MADKSISQKQWEINRQFGIIENLSDNIDEMQALTEIGINCNFEHVSTDSIKNYCYILLSLAKSAKNSTDELMAIFHQEHTSIE